LDVNGQPSNLANVGFSLTREQADIQKAAREFAEGEFRPLARELDAEET
jgi:alkylation response protein AidB-like acyl-CoA dehydrogenase